MLVNYNEISHRSMGLVTIASTMIRLNELRWYEKIRIFFTHTVEIPSTDFLRSIENLKFK